MKQYSPELCIEAEKLYKEGKYEESLSLALDAHERSKNDAKEAWDELVKAPPSELSGMTSMWDTTTQKYVKYKDYIKLHNWEDDIAPAPMKIAEKARKKLNILKKYE